MAWPGLAWHVAYGIWPIIFYNMAYSMWCAVVRRVVAYAAASCGVECVYGIRVACYTVRQLQYIAFPLHCISTAFYFPYRSHSRLIPIPGGARSVLRPAGVGEGHLGWGWRVQVPGSGNSA